MKKFVAIIAAAAAVAGVTAAILVGTNAFADNGNEAPCAPSKLSYDFVQQGKYYLDNDEVTAYIEVRQNEYQLYCEDWEAFAKLQIPLEKYQSENWVYSYDEAIAQEAEKLSTEGANYYEPTLTTVGSEEIYMLRIGGVNGSQGALYDPENKTVTDYCGQIFVYASEAQ